MRINWRYSEIVDRGQNQRKTQRQKQPEGSTQRAGRTKEEQGGGVGKKHTGIQPWHAVEQTAAQSTTGDKATKHSKTETRWEKNSIPEIQQIESFTSLKMVHTLAQKYLIELLMWNASAVQKTLQLTWQEWVNDWKWETVRRKSFYVLARRIYQFWCSSFRLRKRCKQDKNRLFGNGLVVLGLATSHCRNWTWNGSRYVDERPHRYHRQLMSVFVSAGLISAPGTPCLILN